MVPRRRTSFPATYEPGGHFFVFIYLDDILVASPRAEIHKVHLHTVLQRLQVFDLVLNLEKCELGRLVDFLGHRVLSEGVWPLLNLVPAIHEYQRPTDMGSIQSYLVFYVVQAKKKSRFPGLPAMS